MPGSRPRVWASRVTFPNPTLATAGGIVMPQVGAGVWQVPDPDADQVVLAALRAGYRLIDTAAGYGNESGVGRGLAASDVPREETFVTTKLHEAIHGAEAVRRAGRESLDKLGLDQLDLFLIHWPKPHVARFVETWRALISMLDDGVTRAIGVCNFTPNQLERIIQETGVVPSVNQIELHPALPQRELRAFHAKHGIVTQAWSPLASGGMLDAPVITGIAERLRRTAAQVILRWHIENGTAIIPKSVTPARMASNLELFDFTLEDEDLAAIDALETGVRTGPDPDVY